MSDERGNLIIVSNVTDADAIAMKMYSTKFSRMRDIQVFDGLFVAALTQVDGEGKLLLWSVDQLLSEKEDLAEQKAALVLKCGIGRLTCLNMQRVTQKGGVKRSRPEPEQVKEDKPRQVDGDQGKKKKKKQRVE